MSVLVYALCLYYVYLSAICRRSVCLSFVCLSVSTICRRRSLLSLFSLPFSSSDDCFLLSQSGSQSHTLFELSRSLTLSLFRSVTTIGIYLFILPPFQTILLSPLRRPLPVHCTSMERGETLPSVFHHRLLLPPCFN